MAVGLTKLVQLGNTNEAVEEQDLHISWKKEIFSTPDVLVHCKFYGH